MINVNDFHAATDSDAFERAIAALEPDGILIVPPRRSRIEPERDYWLIDRAVLLPANTTVILQNAAIKLSDRCRDNFFRSANCGFGFPDPERAASSAASERSRPTSMQTVVLGKTASPRSGSIGSFP